MSIQTINENDYIKDSRSVINSNFSELDTNKAPLNSPNLTGTPTAPTPTHGDDSTKIATTEFVQDALGGATPVPIPDSEIEEYWDDLDPAEREQYLPLTGGTLTGVVNGVTPPLNDYSTKIATTKYVKDAFLHCASVPIGFEYFQTNPNIPQGSLPLLGGVYSRATYADLWAWVQTQSGYLITDSAWTALSNSQNGNVPFYSSGDGSTTFRVPALKCWIKGTDGTETVGTYLNAGLPNITGSFVGDRFGYQGNMAEQVGAISLINAEHTQGWSGALYESAAYTSRLVLDASNSNSIYGNADTVVPESIVGLWLVKAYGTVEDTGTIDEQAYIDEQLALNVPTGCVQAFAGQTTPQGWLLCDGSAVSRTQYSRLFGVIGTTYGAGDGTDTFNVPNLTSKFIEGSATSGTEHSAGLPNITGAMDFGAQMCAVQNVSGAFSADYAAQYMPAQSTVNAQGLNGLHFDASRSSSIYGNSTTVQPPSVTMRYIIKA